MLVTTVLSRRPVLGPLERACPLVRSSVRSSSERHLYRRTLFGASSTVLSATYLQFLSFNDAQRNAKRFNASNISPIPWSCVSNARNGYVGPTSRTHKSSSRFEHILVGGSFISFHHLPETSQTYSRNRSATETTRWDPLRSRRLLCGDKLKRNGQLHAPVSCSEQCSILSLRKPFSLSSNQKLFGDQLRSLPPQIM